MGWKFKSKERTSRLRLVILAILDSSLDPLTSREISYRVESQTNYRCSVNTVGQVLKPMVENRQLIKRKIVGLNRYTYQRN